MPYSYWGKIIGINLSNKRINEISINDEIYKKYWGGSGIAGYLLYHNYDHNLSPLSEENPLIFMNGILTGTIVLSACKSSFVAKSPLTGIWAESTVGGMWGAEFKKTGFDGLIITGRSKTPVAITINKGNIDIIEVSDLWGKDVYETENYMKNKVDRKAEVACIGPAGENLVKFAGIMVGGNETRAAGRCGLGALMGFKKLKAMAVKGNKKLSLYDSEKIKKLNKEFMPELREKTKGLHDYGTAGSLQKIAANGELPIKNWTLGSWKEGAAKTDGQYIEKSGILTGHYSGYACPIRCGKRVRIEVGPNKGSEVSSPEYETCAGFGANILNDDINYICAANDLCNRFGLDTVDTGNSVSMAIECYENGIIDKEDTDGLELTWGNPEPVLELIKKIAYQEGFGKILAQGIKSAAEKLGGMAQEYAIHTKGLSFAYHDPRAFTSMAANYATANRGACHLESLSYSMESGVYSPDLIGFNKEIDPHGYENKAELAVKAQNFMNTFNALGLCKFLMNSGAKPELITDWLNAATGWQISTDDFFTAGERLHNLKRMYNVKLGISRKDDQLPPRLLSHDRGGALPYMGRLLRDYYEVRNWTPEGIPTNEKLKNLDLIDL
jgi:aldehyde:ferredoxin oxidoreductase